MGVAILIAALVGVSRVYLAAHWASDVLAGWALGAAWAMVCWLITYAAQRRWARLGQSLDQIGGIDGT
jgi:undecaprenyl-diphosphatase